MEQGIVHRDIKPANLLVRRDGIVKLADMGLARAVDESTETGITRAGTTVGTVDYMSPEQARNSKSADVRSDIYSLGCTWYHMLTGAPPFAEGSLTNKLHAHASRTPPDARDKNPAVPEGVVAVMQRMMAKDPADRYQAPIEVIKDLEGALVNKDAVSRKILEALNDEGPQSDDEYATQYTMGAQEDSYPVNFQWSDGGLPVQPGAATAHENLESEPVARGSSRPPSDSAKSEQRPPSDTMPPGSAQTTKNTSPGVTPGAATVPGVTPARGTNNKPAGKSVGAPDVRVESTAPTKQATTPDYGSRPQTTPNKPAPAPNKPSIFSTKSGGGVSKPAATGGRSTPQTLPPPKRKDADAAADTASSMSSQLKVGLTILAILVGLSVILFLASLAQRMGDAVAPISVPIQQTLPPPPVQAGPEQALAAADATNRSPKDELIEHDPKEGPDGDKSLANGDPSTSGAAVAGGDQARIAPDWVDAALPGNVPVLSVRQGASDTATRQFGSLGEALKNIPADGARIVLQQDGPFDLSPVEISAGIVLIEAAQGMRPQIRLVADGEHRKLPWLNVTGATLSLDGVDIVGDAAAVPAADPWSWVRVTSGSLYVRRSSFTLIGKRSAPTIALKLSGALTGKSGPAIPVPRLLVDQSVFRGDGLQFAQLESPGFEAVVRNSLLVAGDAPVVGVRSSEKGAPNVKRQLRFITSTACSSQQTLALSAQGTTNPIFTDLIFLGTLFAATAEAHQPVLLSLEDWPAHTGSMGPYKNLNWTAAGCVALGFHPLLKLNHNDAATVADGPAWKKLWKGDSATTFSTLAWPTDLKAGIVASPLKSWSPKTLEALALALPAGVTPGCPVSGLRAPDFSTGGTQTVERPQRPQSPVPFEGKVLIQVDLTKTDLGKFISSKDWDDSTVFVASGSGQRFSSPITVNRHRLRIQFVQTEGPSLVISQRAGSRSNGDNAAFINVKGGHLELQHGSFTFDVKDPLSVTPWFLYVEKGGFSLRNCRIVVPSAGANRNRGIIRWAGAGAEKTAGNAEFTDYGLVTDSLLIGSNILISADMNRRALVFNNSAFVGRQHLFELNVGLNQGRDPAAFDAQNCTYIAGGTQFTIKSQAASGSNPAPCRILHFNSVFAALPRDAQSKAAPLLMNYVGGVEATSQLQWYEDSCGYAPELKTFIASEMALPATPLPSQDFVVAWTKRWGPDRVQRPLLSSDGVLFEKNLGPNAVGVKPENLTFHSAAKAKTWSETGGPIGVRPQSLEPPPGPPRAAPGTKKAPGKIPNRVVF